MTYFQRAMGFLCPVASLSRIGRVTTHSSSAGRKISCAAFSRNGHETMIRIGRYYQMSLRGEWAMPTSTISIQNINN